MLSNDLLRIISLFEHLGQLPHIALKLLVQEAAGIVIQDVSGYALKKLGQFSIWSLPLIDFPDFFTQLVAEHHRGGVSPQSIRCLQVCIWGKPLLVIDGVKILKLLLIKVDYLNSKCTHFLPFEFIQPLNEKVVLMLEVDSRLQY